MIKKKILALLLSTMMLAFSFTACVDSLSPEVSGFNIPSTIDRYGSVTLNASATTYESTVASYQWSASSGYFNTNTASSVIYTADTTENIVSISVKICDTQSECVVESGYIQVVDMETPIVRGMNIPSYLTTNSSTQFSILLENPMEDYIYFWASTVGTFDDNTRQSPYFNPGSYIGDAVIQVQVCDLSGVCDVEFAEIEIVPAGSPVIQNLNVPSTLVAGSTVNLSLSMEDEGEEYSYFWSASTGSFANNTVKNPIYSVGTYVGAATIKIEVCDKYSFCTTSEIVTNIISSDTNQTE